MLVNGRHKAKPYLVLAISVLFTAIAAMYASRHSLIPIVSIGGFYSLLVFFITRSESVARAAADDKSEQLRRAKHVQEQLDSRHRKAAKALRASEERYRLAARATNDAIWDWDLTTGLVEWNEGIRTLFGYTAEQVGNDF